MTSQATTVGTLVLVGTPIGNLGDLSPRAQAAIAAADCLFCEDTRSPSRLLANLPVEARGVAPRVSCFVGNEHERVADVRQRLSQGQRVVFVSEAGMPVISDPGRLLVEAAVAIGARVEVVPGPSAMVTALALSGFRAEGARFVGFLPRGGRERASVLASIAADPGVSVIFEAGNRCAALFDDLCVAVEEAATRRAVIARELTKLHEEVLRGSLAELRARAQDGVRGEVVVVVEGAHESETTHHAAVALARRVLDVALDPTLRPRERARALATLVELDARALYDRLRGATDETEDG